MHATSRIFGIVVLAGLALTVSACAGLVDHRPATSPEALFDELWRDYDETCASMLSLLDDQHVNLMAPFAFSNSGGRNEETGAFSLDLIRREYLVDAAQAGSGMFTWGRIAADIDLIVEALADTKSLVVDNRGNRGGLTGNVGRIASRLVREERVYAISRTKNGRAPDAFSAPVELTVRPDGTNRYTNPIVFITNEDTISAGEYFTLAMTGQSHVTHVGSGTAGALSLSLERFLANGRRYTVSVQEVTDANGTVLENRGVLPAPEHLVENSADEPAAGVDRQLEHAIGVADR
ncbi:MAG: S41 family peptidase [Spirochaetota bacterium]